ncbi:hypothetical protein ACIA48_02145 [Mycobacterium sp. NPDC051804]|uniref:hypothetical protein n=1 Tax=Mycobacterium sp. NPDC051804 TaxID=3364295 RepID=UPI0037AD5E35
MAELFFDWRFCGKCFGLFWDAEQGKGHCTEGGGHEAVGLNFFLQDAQLLGDYVTVGPSGSVVAQDNWRICSDCRGLYYDGFDDNGSCPAGGGHASGSPNYGLWVLWPPTGSSYQSEWRWCRHCYAMFFGGFEKQGSCPTGGAHDKSESFNYALEH